MASYSKNGKRIGAPPKKLAEFWTCTKCFEEKPISEFGKDSTKTTGKRSYCKACGARYKKSHHDRTYKKKVCPLTEEGGTCKVCNTYKPLSDYPRRTLGGSNIAPTCHGCHKAKKRAATKKRREDPEWLSEFRMKDRLKRGKRLAKKRQNTVHRVDWRILKKRDGYTCYLCGQADLDEINLDHIIPISKNGHHAYYNVCVTCPECNSSKSNKLPHELPEDTKRQVLQKLEELGSPQLKNYLQP